MNRNRIVRLERTARDLRNLLPYFRDWTAWQREIARLERNIVKLRKHRFTKLAKTLDMSLPTLKTVLNEEKREHAFTVNQLIARLSREETRRHRR